jgi:ubiquinol-cytochrome c reductase cytochrome b subunit
MKQLLGWLDHRTGYRNLAREALYENVPGGARWRYVWGSTLTFAFAVQVMTGLALWLCYSPSTQTAWESVFYIQNSVAGGWFLRGLHHYTAQAMNVLLALHLMQVVIDGAYKAPREVNFWFGIGLLVLVLALSLTGYLLPWDQKGFWATKVATNIVAISPVAGPYLQKVLIGGADYGHQTLTRFFALHAGVLPLAVAGLTGVHIYLFRRHGLTAKQPLRKPDAAFWPDQVLKDIVACLAVLAVVLGLILSNHGAELGPPADPSDNFSAARPEWYFLFLYQFLKYFPGGTEAIGAIWIPGFVLALIFLMPILGKWRLGHRFNVGLLFCLLFGAAFLTWQAVSEDRRNPEFVRAKVDAEETAARIKVLAQSPSGIPPAGAITLLRQDPLTQGPKLFAKYCASCHRFGGEDGTGRAARDPESASDLQGFGSRAWLAGLLDPKQIGSTHYFGATKFKDGRMVKFVNKKVSAFSPEQRDQLKKTLAAVSAEASLPSQIAADAAESADIKAGAGFFKDELNCNECHQFHNKDADATAPDLTGYASRSWLISFISNPKQDRFYGDRDDRMPAFGDQKILDASQIALLADWLRGDWYGNEAGKR